MIFIKISLQASKFPILFQLMAVSPFKVCLRGSSNLRLLYCVKYCPNSLGNIVYFKGEHVFVFIADFKDASFEDFFELVLYFELRCEC